MLPPSETIVDFNHELDYEPVTQHDPYYDASDMLPGMVIDSDLGLPPHTRDDSFAQGMPVSDLWKEYCQERTHGISEQGLQEDIFDSLQNAVANGEKLFQPRFKSFNEDINDHDSCKDNDDDPAPSDSESDFGIELRGCLFTFYLHTIP